MTNSKQDNESRLGHDPLEWLEEDIANLTSEDEDTDTPDQPSQPASPETSAQDIPAPGNEDPAPAPAPEPERETEARETEPEAEHNSEQEPELELESAPAHNDHSASQVENSEPEAADTTPAAAGNELIPGFHLSKTDGILTLPERLTVQVAEATHQDWLQITDITDLYTLQIDATRLVELDAAGLQLLFAFSQSLTNQSTQVTLINVPDNIHAVFKLAGLNTYFTSLMEAA